MLISPWLLFSLISSLAWAGVHVLDSHCVDKVFDRYWMGTITTSLMLLVTLPFLMAAEWYWQVPSMPPAAFAACLVAGSLYMLGQVLYLKALTWSEAGIVAAYWNMLPLLLLMAGYFWLGETLSWAKYGGCLLIVTAAASFCLVDINRVDRGRSLLIMFVATCLQVGYFLIVDHLTLQYASVAVSVRVTLGIIGAGLTPLLFRSTRVPFFESWPRIRSSAGVLMTAEALNVAAMLANLWAVGCGSPAMVASVEASIPGFAFLLSLLLFRFTSRYGEEESKHRLPAKLLLVTGMCLGVWLVS